MTNASHEVATLAGGCYWCLEAVFESLDGVDRVESGFSGGARADVSYRDVCSGTTGHAEVVRVTFDPGVVTYRDLLGLFFAFHDPTTLNRQGPDIGTQYRSAIFFQTPEQERIAREVVAELERDEVFGQPIVTEISPETNFVLAEPDHQGYYRRNADQPYCRAMIAPKVAKLRQKYAHLLKDSATRA